MSDGLVSVGSDPQSRSSSAQDSYSTSATTYDDPPDSATPKPETSTSEKRASKPDGKGNVLVSVRVRPTANGDHGNPEGEWMVDGRRSLISYKGKEGGNHIYGAYRSNQASRLRRISLTKISQTMCLLLMITTPEFTTTSPSALFAESWRDIMVPSSLMV